MPGIEEIKRNIVAKHKEARFWKRHYEIDWNQNASENSRRNILYYEGLMRGYEVALDELDAITRVA